jgi:hypothetical protein
MRFWAKGKQGEKKTTRVKPASQSEISSFFPGPDVTPAHPFSDGKNGQRVELLHVLLFLNCTVPLFF